MTSVAVGAGERSQDYEDLLRLIESVRRLLPREAERLAIREYLLAKLNDYVVSPTLVRATRQQEG
jgi:hypothetical protein